MGLSEPPMPKTNQFVMAKPTRVPIFRGGWYTFEGELVGNTYDPKKPTRPLLTGLPIFIQQRKNTNKGTDGPILLCVPTLVNPGPRQRIYVDFVLPSPKLDCGIVIRETKSEGATLTYPINTVLGISDLVMFVGDEREYRRVVYIEQLPDSIRVTYDQTPKKHTVSAWLQEDGRDIDTIGRSVVEQLSKINTPVYTYAGVGGVHQEEQFFLWAKRVRVVVVIHGCTPVVTDGKADEWVSGDSVFMRIERPKDKEFVDYCSVYPPEKGTVRYEVLYNTEGGMYVGQYVTDRYDQTLRHRGISITPTAQ